MDVVIDIMAPYCSCSSSARHVGYRHPTSLSGLPRLNI